MSDELREDLIAWLAKYDASVEKGDPPPIKETIDQLLQACEPHWRELVPKDHIVIPKTDYRLLTGMNVE